MNKLNKSLNKKIKNALIILEIKDNQEILNNCLADRNDLKKTIKGSKSYQYHLINEKQITKLENKINALNKKLTRA